MRASAVVTAAIVLAAPVHAETRTSTLSARETQLLRDALDLEGMLDEALVREREARDLLAVCRSAREAEPPVPAVAEVDTVAWMVVAVVVAGAATGLSIGLIGAAFAK